jgi:uncharacterized protein YndB with AHSA1/START domain
MNKGFIAKQSILIKASKAKVWEALVNPAMIKQYLFGTEVATDWKAGSQIKYRGVWKGKAYEDKGTVLTVIPEKILESTFWSSLSGLPDILSNYKNVRWELSEEGSFTNLTLSQDNNATEEEKNHSEQNWHLVLTSIKAIVEK